MKNKTHTLLSQIIFFSLFLLTTQNILRAEPAANSAQLLRPINSTYYVDKQGGLEILNPKNLNQVIGRLNHGAPVRDSFLLNSDGEPFGLNTNSQPFYGPNQRPYLGVQVGDRVGAINADHLSKVGIRSSDTNPGQNPGDDPKDECCETEPVTQDTGTNPNENLSPEALNAAENSLLEFQNTTCGTMRPTRNSNMAKEIQGLNNEWLRFTNTKLNDVKDPVARQKLKQQLGIAKNLDLVTRTILYEADIMGLREGVVSGRTSDDNERAYNVCTAPEKCAISTCERDIMTLSIRNRGYTLRACADPDRRRELEEKNPEACKYFGDFSYRATNPTQYNIWDPRWTNRFIATCFLKSGREESDLEDLPVDLRWPYRRAIRQYRHTLDSAKRILYKSDEELLNYFNLTEKRQSDMLFELIHMKHYIHPMGMTLCQFGRFNKRISVKAAYAEKINDKDIKHYTLLIDDVLVGDDDQHPHPKDPKDSQLYREIYLRDNNQWFALASEIKDLPPANSNNECLTMGLATTKNRDLNTACNVNKIRNMPNFTESWLLQSRFVPKWALVNYVTQPFIGCQLPTEIRAAEIGDKCDPRFQPYSNVDGTPMLPLDYDVSETLRGLKSTQMQIHDYVITIDKNSADEPQLTSQKNGKTISTLTIKGEAITTTLLKFKRAFSYADIFIIDIEQTQNHINSQRTCADVMLFKVDETGQLKKLAEQNYKCEIESESAREQAKSFNRNYKINMGKNSPYIIVQ